ncbi:PAS domain-containing sensor histidine kinase [Pinibacter aurantiacus]|uniref:histidine kinase n=1 Tax=Pinibacter aurantiacus TaxID=2851599 RepID=A0A9E2SDV4_9BACT|nr:PAS domain S-box protein [Pinibacter aurantiacus]MBV4359623.1 PAS domain S-box protein [Pinibacter aurantiacus]
MIEEKLSVEQLVGQSPIAIAILRGPDYIVEHANDLYLEVVDKKADQLINKSLFEGLPELVNQNIRTLLDGVTTTCIAYHGNEFEVDLVRKGIREKVYFNFVYQPLRNSKGIVDRIVVVATEVTKQVKESHALQESEKQFRSLVMQSTIAMGILRGRELRVELINPAMLKIWQKEESEVLGKTLLEIFPRLEHQRFPQLLLNVYDTGVTYSETEGASYVDFKTHIAKFYFDFTYAPLFEKDGVTVQGIMMTLNNVTEQVEARLKTEENEKRLRLAIRATNLGTFDLNLLENYYGDISPRLKEIFGYNKNESVTRVHLFDQVLPEDIAIVQEAHRVAEETGRLSYEVRIKHQDGSIHWIKASGEMLYDNDKTPVRLLGTVMDITESKLMVEFLRESEERFRIMANTAPVKIWVADTNGKFTFLNKQWLSFTGRSLDEELGDGWQEDIHLLERERVLEEYTSHFNERAPFTIEFKMKRHDGVYRWVANSGVPRYTPEGLFEGYIGSCMDIQATKLAHEDLERIVAERTRDLQEANDLLEKSNAQLEQFAYVSSHDLQEPLRKIQTFSDLVLQKIDEPGFDGKLYIQKVISSAERMSVLIEDLLNFSRINKMDEKFETVDLNKVLENVVNDFEVVVDQKNATIIKNLMPRIKAIPIQMNQLFFNLIGNALKFSDENPVIEISARVLPREELKSYPLLQSSNRNYVELIFKDNGIGFDQSYAEQIFMIFQRLNDKKKYTGTGIGLAVCKKIVENHNGVIKAEGKRGVGAKFTIVLPE